jgi:hypothetical protein
MAVLLPDTNLGIRRRNDGEADAHGDVLPAAPSPTEGPWPGRASEAANGSWTLAVDPEAWPVRERDLIVEDVRGNADREWVVVTADLLSHQVDPSVNYVRIEARLRTRPDNPYEEPDATPTRSPGDLVPG